MKFTGERFIPTEHGRIRLEHYHRYAAVLEVVSGKVVLDVACGEGYGSALMSEVACTVTGVDIADEAVHHATNTYFHKKNLTFSQGSAIALPFADASFDVVVSFETIEHLAEQAEMLAEIRRVLRPDGVLVISSPNRPVYSEESGEHNEFHVKELDFDEFNELLKLQFPVVQYYGQRMMMGSVIQSIQGGQNAYHAWHDDGVSIKPKSGSLKEAVYFVAVCGANDPAVPSLNPSVVFPDQLDLVKHYVGFAKWAQLLNKVVAERDGQIISLNQSLAERDREIARLNQAVTERGGDLCSLNQAVVECDEQSAGINQAIVERDRQIVDLTDETVRRGEWALRLDAELKETKAKLHVITQSNSWRLTLPLREARRWVSMPKQQAKRYIRGGLQIAKRVYQSLPLSYQAKASHRNAVARLFPKLLLLSGSGAASIPALKVPVIQSAKFVHRSPADLLHAASAIDLPTSTDPIVSVIIPIYGQIEYTIHCLASIGVNPPKIPFEVIVVDDSSPDNSVEVLERVRGIRLIRNLENQGFIRSCNVGANSSQGEYLCFLNNDTEVAKDWLDELLKTFSAFPGTGLVGSKLVYPDGRLQEAGGIIWQDGSAWNFGRLQDPSLPVYNYAREVDYCSGASIMVSQSLFLEWGGFDEHYLPAYCEDSDLALKIRDKGYRVIYQPLSTVIHYEGITSGTDTTQGTKAYQIENSKKLFERWQSRLKVHQVSGVDVDNAKDRMAKRRVLVLDHCTPTPDQDAGSVSLFNIMMLLREMDFQVTFIPEDNFLYIPNYTTALQRAGIEVLYAPYVTSVEQHLKEAGSRYELAFLFRPTVVERNIKAVRKYCSLAAVLYYPHDLHYLRMSREADLLDDAHRRQAALEMKCREFEAIKAVDATIVVSTAELEILHPELPNQKIFVLPLILDICGTEKKYLDRRDIVFVGGYQHTPNVDAVQFFVSEIMPLLRKRLPSVRFYAVGSKPPAEIQELASEDVIITGFVEDLNPLLDKMRVSVAPLRYGAGIKGKVGCAMAAGLPVIATSLAAEGMSLTSGENILVADGAEKFASSIVKIYEDELLWSKLSKAGLEFADQAWGAEAAWNILANILVDIGIVSERGANKLSLYGATIDAAR